MFLIFDVIDGNVALFDPYGGNEDMPIYEQKRIIRALNRDFKKMKYDLKYQLDNNIIAVKPCRSNTKKWNFLWQYYLTLLLIDNMDNPLGAIKCVRRKCNVGGIELLKLFIKNVLAWVSLHPPLIELFSMVQGVPSLFQQDTLQVLKNYQNAQQEVEEYKPKKQWVF